MELKSKIVVITGGSEGMGLALSRLFRDEGARVVVCAKSFEETEEGITQKICDVTDEVQVEKFINEIIAEFGGINIFVNNAGIWIPHGPVEATSTSDVRDVFDVNFFGTYLCSKYVIKHFKQTKGGVLLNIISEGALEGRAGSSVYRASKFAVNGLTKSIRMELADSGIKVLSVYPGRMKTNLFDKQIPDNYEEFMDPVKVSKIVLENLKRENPEEELVLR